MKPSTILHTHFKIFMTFHQKFATVVEILEFDIHKNSPY